MIARTRQAGLSLIELMIGVAVVAVLLVLALPSIGSAMQNRRVRAGAEAVQTGLTVARAEALRRNRNVKFQLQAGSNSWVVGCETPDAGTDSTTGEVLCPQTIQSRNQQEGSARAAVTTSQQLSGGGSASSSTFTDTLSFTPLGRTTTATLPAGNVAVFDVSSPMDTCAAAGGEIRCLRVVVTSAGQIRM
ncbi:GspH/FimT family pseudopilin, partial [Ramlibacter sp.]|uniref:GspH/FimT family pseudopilin n=1 Tax=Ramlibacter sp. TaxID=1917967 RepID=UPI00260191A3